MPAEALTDVSATPQGVNFIPGPACHCRGATLDGPSMRIKIADDPCDLGPGLTLASNSFTTANSPELIRYQSFNGTFYDMTAWQGDHVSLLVPVQAELDPQVMANLLTAFDGGWEYYSSITGREPTLHYSYGGRGTIAVVQETCGAGCGFLGFTGVEIIYDFFGAGLEGPFPWVLGLYDDMAENLRVQQIVFYELGRNFWFYGNQLGDWGFTTGFAVVNRYYAMQNSGFALAEDEGRFYHEEQLPVVAATYFQDDTLSAENTLAIYAGVANPTGFNGVSDLSASLLRIFREQAGASDYASFWQSLASAPQASTSADSFANFTATAEQVSFFDFSFLFKTGWTFQVGSGEGDEILADTGPADRKAVLGFGGDDILRGSSNSETLLGDYGDDSLFGNGGDDQLGGGAGNDSLAGGEGDDVLLGADGADKLSGGAGIDLLRGGLGADSFQDIKSGLNGDTITDFGDDDKIVITDALLAGFSFSLEGNTLTYTGGSVTLTGFSGQLVASAAAGGGVQLTVSEPLVNDVRNDFNGDGRSDVLWRNDDGRVISWLGRADGTFGSNPNGNFNVSAAWNVVGIADFNGDGTNDVLWRNNDGRIIDWLGKTDGGFASNPNGNFAVSNAWQVAGVGDFNGDGRSDVLWRNTDGRVIDWLGKENGGFASNPNGNFTVSNAWQVAGVGDFNGDGRDDVLWRNADGRVIDWFGKENGGFASNPNGNKTVSTSWHIAGVGDFNGDGRDDILWRNDDGRVIDWLGKADGGFAANPNGNNNVAATQHVASIGDFNGDGRDDILWRGDSGTVTEWLGYSAGSFAANASAIYNVSNSWHVQAPDLM